MHRSCRGSLGGTLGGGFSASRGACRGLIVDGMSLPPFEHLRSALIAAAALLALMLTLLGPAPAGAVIGGEEIDGASVPWFSYSACGGTLVAPDRIVTAAHCVGGRQIASFDQL